MNERAAPGEWIGLAEQTRQALANLRADELEQLAARAQRMLDASGRDEARGRGESDRRGAAAGGTARVGMLRQHRLLRDLLLATEKNMDVLRRVRSGGARARETSSPWAR
jgi:hypothetical protein